MSCQGDKPRIVQVVHGFSVEGPGGGANRFAIELARALPPSHYQRAVWGLWDFSTSEEKNRRAQLNDEGIETAVGVPWVESRPHQSWVNSYRVLRKKLAETTVVLFNSHTEFGDPPLLLFKLTARHLKIVRTVHGGHYREWDRRPLRRLFLTHLLYPLFFDGEVGVAPRVVNELNRRFLSRLLGREARFLPNAINLERFSSLQVDVAAKRESLNVPDGNYLIGTVGRLVEQKGYAYLIEAASMVVQQIPNVTFIFIGDGPLAEELGTQAARLGLSKKVIFTGMRADIESLYLCMDLFVSSSLWEGLPTVIMESMASGVPVVATDIPGSRELVRHLENGWLVPPKDSNALANAILSAFQSNNQKDEMARQGRREIGNYTIQAVAAKYRAFYAELLE